MSDWVKQPCESGLCVEVFHGPDYVGLRTSLLPSEVVWMSVPEWQKFTEGVKQGTFDRVEPGE